MSDRCAVKLLGRLAVLPGADSYGPADREISRFRTHKTAILLARLAYYRDRPHPREELIDLLWPDSDIELGRNNLSKSLSSLRHQLEPPGSPMNSVLLADREKVQLNPASVVTDVGDYELALRRAERAATGHEKLGFLQQALQIYAGELLPGFYEDWSLLERERLKQAFVGAAVEAIALLEAGGELSRAIEAAQQGLAADPLSEDICRTLMKLLESAGQPAQALRAYRDIERRLRDELGDEPGPEIRQIAERIRRGEEGKKGVREDAEAEVAAPIRNSPTQSRLPAGTVTFLIVGFAGGAPDDEIRSIQRLARQHGGHEIRRSPEMMAAVFPSAGDGLECAAAIHRAAPSSPHLPSPISALSLHTGDVADATEYDGEILTEAFRIATAAHPGQILCSKATAGLVRSDNALGIRLKDLGAFRLPGAAAASHLFQIDDPAAPTCEFPPPVAESARGRSLPLQFNRFFGRDRDISLLHDWLADSATRAITLTGPGGCGKTRLALETVDRLPASDMRPAWFVPLAESTTVAAAEGAIRDALRIPAGGSEKTIDQIAALLSREPSILILDNFEQVVDAGAPLVRTLLEAAPRLTCIVTSRQLLSISGEREFNVQPLAVPAETPTPEQLTLCDSVRLFVDRAQTARPDFQVTAANAAAVAELCTRLEGIPLAIELAAARAMVLSPAQMVDQLRDRFAFLTSRRRDTAVRHRTLRAAIDWSFQLLPEELRDFFTALAVFRGGCTLAAAEAVTGEPLALDHLQQLRECSLLTVDESEALPRFRMLESLREYALGRLEGSKSEVSSSKLEALQPGTSNLEFETLQQRHAECFLALAEEMAPKLRGGCQADSLARLAADHDNLRAAVEYGFEPPRQELGARLAIALAPFWNIRGFLAEGRETLSKLLRSIGKTSIRNRIALLHWAGTLAYSQGDFEEAREAHAESLASARELEETNWIALGLHGLGWVEFEQGDYDSARRLFEESLELRRRAGDEWGIQSSLIALGVIASNRAEYAVSESLFQKSMEIQRKLGDERGIATCLNNLGILARRQGDYETARARYEECLEIRQRFGDRRSIAACQSNLGMALLNQGDLSAAKAQFEESLEIRREIGDRWGIAVSLSNLGIVAARQGEIAVAEQHQRESLSIRAEMGDQLGIAVCLESMAEVMMMRGQFSRAAQLAAAAATVRESIHTPLPSSEAGEMSCMIANLKARLGLVRFDHEWSAGAALSPAQAVDLALSNSDFPPT